MRSQFANYGYGHGEDGQRFEDESKISGNDSAKPIRHSASLSRTRPIPVGRAAAHCIQRPSHPFGPRRALFSARGGSHQRRYLSVAR